MKSSLNPEEHRNCINGSKVTVILRKSLILPIGGVALEGSAPAACAAGLFQILRLVPFRCNWPFQTDTKLNM